MNNVIIKYSFIHYVNNIINVGVPIFHTLPEAVEESERVKLRVKLRKQTS